MAVTAETGELRALDEIIDTPLSSKPELPPTHRDYERRMVDRLRLHFPRVDLMRLCPKEHGGIIIMTAEVKGAKMNAIG